MRAGIKSHIRENRNLLIIVLLGFIARLYALEHIYIINTDSVVYLYQARAVSAGMWDAAKSCGYPFVSIYPLFTALFQKLFNDWVIAANAVSLFFGTGTIIPMYRIMRRFFSGNVAGMATLVFAFNPVLVKESAEIMKDPVFWFFSVLGLYLFVKASDGSKGKLFVLSSISFCLGSLARIEGMVLFGGSLVFLTLRRERKASHILSFGFPLIILVMAGIGSFFVSEDGRSLWSIYVLPRFQTVHFRMFFENPFNNAMTEKLMEMNSQRIAHFSPKFFKYVKANLWLIALGVILSRILQVLYYPFAALFVIGIRNIKNEIKKEPLLGYFIFLSIISFAFLYLLLLRTWVMEKRYIAAFFFPSFIIIGFALQRVIDLLKNKGLRDKTIIMGICILSVALTVPQNLKSTRKDKLPYRQIGEFIAEENPGKISRIAASGVWVNYYANKDADDLICPVPDVAYGSLTRRRYPDLIALLKSKKMEYFLWEEDQWRNAPYDFPDEVSDRDMTEAGEWKIKENRLVLFKIKKKR